MNVEIPHLLVDANCLDFYQKSKNLSYGFERLSNVLEEQKQVQRIGWRFFHAEFEVKGAGFFVFGVDKKSPTANGFRPRQGAA